MKMEQTVPQESIANLLLERAKARLQDGGKEDALLDLAAAYWLLEDVEPAKAREVHGFWVELYKQLSLPSSDQQSTVLVSNQAKIEQLQGLLSRLKMANS